MTAWASLLLAFAAFTLIASTMERHRTELGTSALSTKHLVLVRTLGWVLLGLSLLPCALHWSVSLALATWVGGLAFAAGALGLMLTYFSAPLVRVAPIAAVLGAALWLLPP